MANLQEEFSFHPNLWLYGYRANNPVIYKDPTGKFRTKADWTIDVMYAAQDLNNMLIMK